MESGAPGTCSDSSRDPNRGSSSDRSTRELPKNLPQGRAAEDGGEAAGKQETCVWLLSQLQSILGELNDRGVATKFFRGNKTLIITLADTAICQQHTIIYSGRRCPVCKQSENRKETDHGGEQ